jgi:hypothetical protein
VDSATREILDAPTRRFIGLLRGILEAQTTSDAGVETLLEDVNTALILAGNVPQCAMRVRRSGDLGALSSWAPPVPCECSFEKTATATTECQACPGGTDAECTNGGKCRSNYCEAY